MTLLGFDNMRWVRGNRSVCFSAVPAETAEGTGVQFEMRYIDHDTRTALVEVTESTAGPRATSQVTPEELDHRLANPVTSTRLDDAHLAFSKLKGGLWGFQHDRVEQVQGYSCQVYGAAGMTLETRTRVEHLPASHPARRKARNPISRLVSTLTGSSADQADQLTAGCFAASGEEEEKEEAAAAMAPAEANKGVTDGTSVTAQDEQGHGDGDLEPEDATGLLLGEGKSARRLARHRGAAPGQDLETYLGSGAHALEAGRPRRVQTQKQALKMTLWMSNDFPLSFREQVLPIIDLLAPTNHHIAKLRDFVSLQLPAGFPVKVEMPFYHVLTGRVTFGNYTAGCADPEGAVFSVPPGYRVLHPGAETESAEERMLALALQASMQGHDQDDVYYQAFDADLQQAILASMGVGPEATPNPPGGSSMGPAAASAASWEEAQLAEAIARSLGETRPSAAVQSHTAPPVALVAMTEEEQLAAVLALSLQEQ
jgi:hypothetical protein